MSLSTEIVDRLKQILRTKNVSYRMLAKGLGMSEAAMKRAFSEQAFSLKRLEEICNYLKISTRDLLAADLSIQPLGRMLSEEQELLLASDEKLMCFFYLIAASHSLSYVKSRYRFSDSEITRYLLALDRSQLIRLDAHNKFKILVDQDFHWRDGGMLEAYYSREIRRDFIDHSFAGARDGELVVAGLLSTSSLETVRKRLKALEDDVREMIRLDTKYRDDKMANITLYCAYRPWALPMMKKYRKTKAT